MQKGLDFSLLEYSVDMVRMKAEITRDDFFEFFRVFQNDPSVGYREMTSISAYRHNFYFKELIDFDKEFEVYKEFLHHGYREFIRIDKGFECGFWVGVEHNSRFEKSKYIDIVIEYNPNKCFGSIHLDYVLRSFFSSNRTTVVKKIDFAVDFPFDIKDVHLVRDFKANYRVFDNGGSDKTYYMRKRGSNGAFKLYNKQLESCLDSVKTRYEVTLHVDNALEYMDSYSVDLSLFPNVRLTSNVQFTFGMDFLKVTGTDKVLLLACMEHPEYLKELSRDKRKKIESILDTLDNVVSFSECQQITHTVRNYFKQIMNYVK